MHFDGVTPVLTLGLVAQNVSNQQMTIKSIVANLFTNNYLVGNLASFTPQVILPTSQVTLYVDVRLSPLSIVNDIIRAIQYGNFQQNVVLKGDMNVDNMVLPVDMNYKIG